MKEFFQGKIFTFNKKTTGFYYLLEFKAPAAFIQKLETEFKRDERVMRHLVVKMDKEHVDFAARRRKNIKEGKSVSPIIEKVDGK